MPVWCPHPTRFQLVPVNERANSGVDSFVSTLQFHHHWKVASVLSATKEVKSNYTQATGGFNPLVLCRLCLNQNFPQSGDTSDGPLPSSVGLQLTCVGRTIGLPPQTRGLRRQQNPLPQKINIGPAVHLPFEHLQPVNLAFDRTRAPGQGQSGLAGLDQAIPGQDSFSHFRKRVGHSVVDQTTDIMVQLFIDFGLIKGETVSTDGQLEPTHSRFKGCAYACKSCQELPLDEAQHHDLDQQLQSGSMRLEIICPFPEVVDKVRQATAKTGTPKDPKVTLLEVEPLPPEQASSKSHHQLAELLDVPKDQLPPVRLNGARLQG